MCSACSNLRPVKRPWHTEASRRLRTPRTDVLQSPDFDLDHAVQGTLTLAPSPAMLEPPEPDYRPMARMIMGAVPFGEVMDAVWVLERQLSE
jgi:hypothetical protein